ncbi:hypothetical protein DDE74_07610 [Streptomyces lydicus]|uniref:Uncharacterized protein n=1 Tax=Streptomyces lydicus TaxID=47763 RepID=A0A3S9Y7Z6_9ACTN|nr:hypothetical protein [Streptomyces lydicus]AZS70824.1 hypothetical protein DDE74_07610 [Streptomyces lydicus]
MAEGNLSRSDLLAYTWLLNNRSPETFEVAVAYEDVIRMICVLGIHQRIYSSYRIQDVVSTWIDLGKHLRELPGWRFSFHDLEGAWVKGSPSDAEFTISVSVDEWGPVIQVTVKDFTKEPVLSFRDLQEAMTYLGIPHSS